MPGDSKSADISVLPTHKNNPVFSKLVWAKDKNKHPIQLCVDPATIRSLEDTRLNYKIGEYCGLIHGAVPNGTDGLKIAHALFRGVKRPRIKSGHDERIHIYVLNPETGFVYPARAKFSGDGPQAVSKPNSSVFVVYAEFEEAEVDGVSVGGQIFFWEWVLADLEDLQLPINHENRYIERIW